MRPHDDKVYLQHILDSISLIQKYTKGLRKEKFFENTLYQDAAIRQIQIVGEASKLISQDLKLKHAEIPWRNIAGMRDKLVHDYLGVDIEAVWLTIDNDLPILAKQIKGIL